MNAPPTVDTAMHTLKALPALVLCALLATGPLRAQTLTPPEQRISDQAIQADQQTFEATQGRIKALNDAGRPLRDYHLAKAQCWLDVSFHEYTRNDRSAFPQAALNEAALLIDGMQSGRTPLPMDTPLVNDAARLRPDLWAAADSLRGHAGWRCAQARAACAEVELVHAGNEFKQQQWRHAKPYVQIAEDLVGEAQALAAQCVPPPAPPMPVVAVLVPLAAQPAPPAPPAPSPTAAPPVRELQLAAGVLFNFDKHDVAGIRAFSLGQLQRLAQRLKDEGWQVQSLRLSGYADRLNGTGHSDYNQRLSERRVATVRQVLVGLGLDANRMQVQGLGDGQQIARCDAKLRAAELQECLLPNRRVEVLVNATAAPR